MKNTIIIFGFTGSGKSTIANMVGKELGLRVIHPSSILKELLQGKKPHVQSSREGKGFWESPEGIKLFKERLNEKNPMDFTCDQILLKEIKKGSLVMDSWTMPWLAKDAIMIRLDATIATRSKRLADRSTITIQEARRAIFLRDNATRNLYLDRFDIKKDNHVFDFIIKTDRLSEEEVLQRILGKIYEKNNS